MERDKRDFNMQNYLYSLFTNLFLGGGMWVTSGSVQRLLLVQCLRIALGSTDGPYVMPGIVLGLAILPLNNLS